jgi:hypothetical protein
VPYVSDVERYVQEYKARRAASGVETAAPPGRRRTLVLTAAFTPMIAVAASPLTALVAVVATIVANVTARWVGVVLLVGVVVGWGYLTARWATNYDDMPATRGWRRWLPLAITVVVVGLCLAEIVSGSHVPDPVVALWFASMVWVYTFLPLAGGVWSPARRALWAAGPTMMFAAIVFVWTQGFFSLRFDRAVSDFDALAQQVISGDEVADGTHVGAFTVHQVERRPFREEPGCDVGFWITGWHQDDTRYLVHCSGQPAAESAHLAGDWWELTDEKPPSDL